MGKVKVVLNRAGVGEVLKSSGAQRVCAAAAGRMMGGLSHGYGMSTGTTDQRAKANIFTTSFDGMLDNWKNNSLAKALGNG